MPIIQKLTFFFKKFTLIRSLSKVNISNFNITNSNVIIFLSFIVFFSIIYFFVEMFVSKTNQRNKDNALSITKSSDFSNLTKYFTSKINSPYEEVNYIIKNNDSIEKILKKYGISIEDIKRISNKLKEKKLSNIYSGRNLNLIFKKLDNNSKTVVNLLFPISNTNSVEVRKYKDDFLVKENILKLYKKEVVIKNVIKNNLYSSAVKVNIEPNIIVEFARIFGFEVDFQRISERRLVRNLL